MRCALSSFALTVWTASAGAGVVGVKFGTEPPPAVLGPYEMLAFPPDPRPLYESVTWVPGPTGDVLFSSALNHRKIGSGWAGWGHGYMGDIYFNGWGTPVTLALPADTRAFILYAAGDSDFALIMVTADDGTSLSQFVEQPVSAAGYGFYTTGDSVLSSLTVSSVWGDGFAIGEFSTAIPEPGALALFGAGAFVLLRHRQSRGHRFVRKMIAKRNGLVAALPATAVRRGLSPSLRQARRPIASLRRPFSRRRRRSTPTACETG